MDKPNLHLIRFFRPSAVMAVVLIYFTLWLWCCLEYQSLETANFTSVFFFLCLSLFQCLQLLLSLARLWNLSDPVVWNRWMMQNPRMKDGFMECPLYMEPLEIDDVNFFPCTCGYQICRFCWHHIRTDENGLCPACRKVDHCLFFP